MICVRDYNEAKKRADELAGQNAGDEDKDEKQVVPRRQLVGGGGSLAATGLQMSQAQNRGAAVVIEPELDLVNVVSLCAGVSVMFGPQSQD